MHHDPRDPSLIKFCKEKQNPFSDSFGFKNPILDFLKETHPKLSFWQIETVTQDCNKVTILVTKKVLTNCCLPRNNQFVFQFAFAY